jgi:hypothetical protein
MRNISRSTGAKRCGRSAEIHWQLNVPTSPPGGDTAAVEFAIDIRLFLTQALTPLTVKSA